MDLRMMAGLAGAVDNVAAFCAEHGISRQTFYKWRRRFAEAGVAGLEDRSHAAVSRPGVTPGWVEDEIVRARKELADAGADCGPDPIRWRLLRAAALPDAVVPVEVVPSRATIARVLTRRGMVVPAPQKRPRSAMRRFVYPRPNECWQSDWTWCYLADETPVGVAGTLDDHSRYLGGITAATGDATKELVWAVMIDAIATCGIPVRSLTDNGMVYSLARRGRTTTFEANLRALGTQPICSSPYHPGTCGKIERFWQTLKKWLDAHDPPNTVDELNTLLAVFAAYYNHERPHRALRGATPAEVFAATPPARPPASPIPVPVTTSRVVADSLGRANALMLMIALGSAWAGHTVDVIRDGNHALVFSGATLVRDLEINPDRRYQPLPQRTRRTTDNDQREI